MFNYRNNGTELNFYTSIRDTVLDNVDVAVVVFTPHDRILFINNKAQNVFDIQQYISGCRIDELFDDTIAGQFKRVLRCLDEVESFSEELGINKSESEVCYLRTKWNKQIFEDELFYIFNGIDITDQVKLKRQILKDQRHYSIGILAGGIAHDLNNLLTPIKLAADFLTANEVYKNDNDHLEIIRKSSSRASSLVNKILMFSGGGEYTKKITTDVRDLIRDLIKIAEKTFPKNIDIKYSIPSELSMIEADPVQIQQVLLNICINAKDAMPFGGVMDIKVGELELEGNGEGAPGGRYISVAIEDTGCGIPEKLRDRLYDPSFTTKEQGSGLGLSTAREIINDHCGYINFHSSEDRGTTFIIYLPVHSSEKDNLFGLIPEKYQELESLSRYLGNGQTILVVDDEIAVLESLSLLLNNYNYRVITANDGAEALEMYYENRDLIRLVIMDIIMPFVDGLNLTRALKKYDNDLKIIGSSGYDQDETVIAAKKEIDRFLKKPYGSTELLSNIKNLLD